jgi:hypothetical protein
MSTIPDSYVSSVLLARHSRSYGIAPDRCRWRRLTASLQEAYRLELHYMRGPGPKWCEKHPERGHITISLV